MGEVGKSAGTGRGGVQVGVMVSEVEVGAEVRAMVGVADAVVGVEGKEVLGKTGEVRPDAEGGERTEGVAVLQVGVRIEMLGWGVRQCLQALVVRSVSMSNCIQHPKGWVVERPLWV